MLKALIVTDKIDSNFVHGSETTKPKKISMQEEILKKIKSISLEKQLSESQVDHLMTLIRKQMEHMNKADRKKYALLNFYCNWSKHIKISRSSIACEIILQLNKVLYCVKDSSDTNKVISEISSVISFPKLQTEINMFLKEFDLPVDLVTDFSRWREFVSHLINIIIDCPLVLPDIRKKEVTDTLKKGVVASQLRLTEVSQKVFEPVMLKNYKAKKSIEDSLKVLVLHITMSDTTSIVLPYLVTWEKNKVV